MKSLLIKWFPFWFLKKDLIFNARKVASKKFFNGWQIVELGGEENIILTDMYYQIASSADEHSVKINKIIGLRFQALAMALRRGKRIPLNWQDPLHITWLSKLPNSILIPALDAVSELSGIDFIGPTVSAQKQSTAQQSDTNSVDVDKEETNANPS